jgi:hypothetical protein
MSRKVPWGRYILAALAGVLVVTGYLYWVEQAKPHYAAVGDCVDSPKAGRLVHVSCSSSGALKVVAKFSGDDSNQCDSVPGTEQVFVEYPTDEPSFVLCAGSVSAK